MKRTKVDYQAGAFDQLYFSESSDPAIKPPFVEATTVLVNGELRQVSAKSQDCNKIEPIYSPVRKTGQIDGIDAGSDKIQIGNYAFCTKELAQEIAKSAHTAFGQGRGEWPRATPKFRIECVKKFMEGLHNAREEIANLIMWEICKTKADAFKEVDRTVAYIKDTIAELKKLENTSSQVVQHSGIVAQIKRSPLGVSLCGAPFNYPLNETYTTLIPALIMGNTIILKTPRQGGLCHMPTLRLFQECFPKGVVNILHGSGREIFSPIMASGLVNILAFIGTSKAANALHQQHPRPFTVRLALGLDAKNPAIVLPKANLTTATQEVTLGSLSYNGQRCTAIKIVFVHKDVADKFVPMLAESIDKLKIGLPWAEGTKITPLAEPPKPAYLRDVINDCLENGAKIVNKKGGQFDRTFVSPTVLYPCNLKMRATHEEQFGPIVPIVPFSDVRELEEYMMQEQEFGQQAAIFTEDSSDLPPLIDFLSHHVTRININSQCQRGPDIMPFSGRKCSATGTLSIHDALRTMSIRVAVATKENDTNVGLMSDVLRERKSNVLRAELLI